jgi:hypothetical protein
VKKVWFLRKFFFTFGKTYGKIFGLAMARRIFVPVAQFWEKAVEVTPPTHYLASGKYLERWKLP